MYMEVSIFMDEVRAPIMLSIRETAERANLSEKFVRKLCKNNQIPFVKSGRKYLVNWQKFVTFLNCE